MNTSIKKSKTIEMEYNLDNNNNNFEETSYYQNYNESEHFYSLENDS